jgi:hypothetical protein
MLQIQFSEEAGYIYRGRLECVTTSTLAKLTLSANQADTPPGGIAKIRSIMIENNGTTPENTQAPVPVTFESLDSALAKIAELQSQVNELVVELARSRDRAREYGDIIERSRRYIEDTLSGDINAQQTYEDFQVPFELLGVEATREVQVTVTANWSGTVKLPYGTDLYDVGMTFSAEFDDLEGDLGWQADDYEIREG